MKKTNNHQEHVPWAKHSILSLKVLDGITTATRHMTYTRQTDFASKFCHLNLPLTFYSYSILHFLTEGVYLQREREIFNPLSHSPNNCNGQSWADPMPGARSLPTASYLGIGTQGPKPFSSVFPVIERELDQKRGSQELNQNPYGMLPLQAKDQPTESLCWPLCNTLFYRLIIQYGKSQIFAKSSLC